MKIKEVNLLIMLLGLLAGQFIAVEGQDQHWSEPPVVEPQYDGTVVPPPQGAVILFDGQNANGWVAIPNKNYTNQSSQFIWMVENHHMEVVTPHGAHEQRLVGTKETVITVYHNHVLVQDHLTFPSSVQASTLRLQDHLNPVRFRNIWFLPGEPASLP